MTNEIIVVNKEVGFTSRYIVNKLTKILNNKKIGHTGTLDPLASGVLVCLTGKYTKLANLMTSLDKEYVAEIKLGIKTDTLDIMGKVLEKQKINILKETNIINVLNSFVGTYAQDIPMYSAIHINGKRLYEYARSNEFVKVPKRKVTIKEIKLLEYQNDVIKFRVVVSKGTYIRTLIQDILKKLNNVGTMSSLVRTRQGNFNVENSYTLKDIELGNYQSLELKDVIDLQVVSIKEEWLKKIENGNELKLNYEGYVLFKDNDKEVALYEFIENIGHIKILF